ncbi:AAA family ATPase [Pseudomonas laurylsulfatiphila]
MNILKSFTIEGLWGDGPLIKSNLDDKFNFLIGQNGTGKTTVINLIAAVLTGDFDKLDRIPFKKITLVLKEVKGRKNPTIEVSKNKSAERLYSGIKYLFRASTKDDPVDLSIEAFDTEGFYRNMPPHMARSRVYRERVEQAKYQLSQQIKVSWLSVHRNNNEELKTAEERRFLPAIDQKLRDLNNNLVRYFSQLAKRYSDHTLEFQRKSFLSVFTPEAYDFIFDFAKNLDINDEKKTLAEIFDVLGVESKHYTPKLKTHFEKLGKAVQTDRSKTITSDVFATLYNSWRAHSLVGDYKELQKRRSEIFLPRDMFLDLINDLFSGRKIASVSEKNELTICTKNKTNIPLEELSSGEKQLIIILGEAVLQNSEPCIYIADEPELSLHISWQEQLTLAISKLNKNAQIIFATHSPDIVGSHQDNVINMESILG